MSTKEIITRVLSISLGLYVVGALALTWWWDYEPDIFDVRASAEAYANAKGEKVVTGYVTTHTVIEIANTLLEKRGGYLSNDLFPPGVWMDNVPEWEFGALTQLRDAARAFRIDFSRSQSQSQEDKNLSEAEGRFFFDNSSWAFPRTEDEYRSGIRLFKRYLGRLADPSKTNAQFYARADNLQGWLQGVETRLGSLSQRLSASVGKRQLNLDLNVEPGGNATEPAPAEADIKTPWLEIDNVFFEARGQTWALLHLLKAIEDDFGRILERKSARVSISQIIRDLEPTQETVWSPMILNGDGMGTLANHSLVMASYVSRVHSAISELRTLLSQG